MIDVTRADILRAAYNGPMSDEEVEFLRDVQGFAEFAIRNGLSFSVFLSVLGHDVNALGLQHGFSLEDARKSGFLPKVTGYAEVTEDDAGDPTE